MQQLNERRKKEHLTPLGALRRNTLTSICLSEIRVKNRKRGIWIVLEVEEKEPQ